MRVSGAFRKRSRDVGPSPGSYRHKVNFQVRTLVDDGRGGKTETWADSIPWFVSISPLSGRELFVAEQMETRVSHRIEGMYNSAINTTEYRIKFLPNSSRTVYFDIRYILDREMMGRDMTIYAEEIVGKES